MHSPRLTAKVRMIHSLRKKKIVAYMTDDKGMGNKGELW